MGDNKKPWLLLALITTVFWGIWGAFIEIPEKAGFPATLGYVVWSLTMIPCALVALYLVNWKLDTGIRPVLYGMLVGLTGAGGQLILFQAVREGPAYIVFPIISLFPIVTILLSALFLKETTTRRSWTGIVLALIAILLLSYQQPDNGHAGGYGWLVLAIIVFLLWGVQGFFMKFSNDIMKAESIFFYMALSGVLLSPVAIGMTDFSANINWGLKGPYLATLVHVLNAVGALTLVYAMRYGKAIIVIPVTGLSPVITIVLSLMIYSVFPHYLIIAGLVVAVIAIYLLSE
ncbi:EamA family transporter [Chitinophaga sp. XS-30]|uniref:EamA family transporter n=1 Tax=Chitinophaga sp. XS-30 TaxID=2604421 RepID=UPI0011DD7D44|nr:EamA family transporter [Chitinophaga sp. XS-30]QEH43370.1 DMT family transporter [Chitinophaga sp. XS-30]